ncbi:uncharacterized protein LOC110709723 [Chenopodium quinoa]|uniref:uncharacterized protein LOC110709723 n=1 Tax=Chenopodium quinoa TaxID=63459 RepID=UPI000B78D431|nr:uncharacterized protein LOC110709723 [Chenopodium quinoa]
MKVVKARRRERQIQWSVCWEFVGAQGLERSISLSLEPRHYILFDSTTGQDREYLRDLPSGEVDPFPLPPIIRDMSILYWNERGIARMSFLRNIRLLIQQHQSHMLVISEVRVGRLDTDKIVRKLTYDEWLMVEPAGLSGGIVVLWRSDYVSFEPTRTTSQGIHGIVQMGLGLVWLVLFATFQVLGCLGFSKSVE